MSALFDALLPTHAKLANHLHKPARKKSEMYQLRKSILEAIWIERLRQKDLLRQGKIEFDCASPTTDPLRKLAVVTEEHGEVAKEILEANNYTKAESRKRLKAELTQLVAVGIAWLESLEDENAS